MIFIKHFINNNYTMGKYNERYKKKKKKLCPKCNRRVYNATLTCKLLDNNKECGYKFVSRKQKELSDAINGLVNDVIFRFQEESKSNSDIQIINELAKFKNIRCLSPYEKRELEVISPKNSSEYSLKPVKLIY
tara:strand:+ start:181 stop:579 length:399 start_codon:yes stop_codon:yes gene_type:complete